MRAALAPKVRRVEPEGALTLRPCWCIGVDCHGADAVRTFCRGHLSLTDAGLRKRDFFVMDECLSRGVPVATVIGGGYSTDMDELASRHAIHAEVAAALANCS